MDGRVILIHSVLVTIKILLLITALPQCYNMVKNRLGRQKRGIRMSKAMKLFLALVLAMSLVLGTVALAEGYPFSSVTMIVPYGAGGTTDLVGRQFATALGKVLGSFGYSVRKKKRTKRR